MYKKILIFFLILIFPYFYSICWSNNIAKPETQKKVKHIKTKNKSVPIEDSKGGINALIKKLLDGNKRFASGKSLHPNQTGSRRTELSKKQKPFAVIISCSDSRVPPEIIFDQGLGDLFVIRSAGGLIDAFGLGSVEYAVEHLGVKLIVVLAHSNCGAVEATIQTGDKIPGNIVHLVDAIHPAVEKAKSMKGDLLENAIKLNAEQTVEELKKSSKILSDLLAKNEISIISAEYNLNNGLVELYK